MRYQSVDQLQNFLAKSVFSHTKDAKKASGRALGTLVEIATYYLLKSWGLEQSISIERRIPEFGNPLITHNVEYSLHPIVRSCTLKVQNVKLPLTAAKIVACAKQSGVELDEYITTDNVLLTSSSVLRNACTVATKGESYFVAILEKRENEAYTVTIVEQFYKPFAIFECKRVGVEEGMKKGPQTIEKAKQGAYVAKSISSLHKHRKSTGELQGLIVRDDGSLYGKSYEELVLEVIDSEGPTLLRDFILTSGVVSNHGNWFTADNQNKEMRVLAQSYDWLVFLTDEGLSQFINELLINPEPLIEPAKSAFLASYTHDKKSTQFTKVQMNYDADQVLQTYFTEHEEHIESWFNVITPLGRSLTMLKEELINLRSKKWAEVH